MPISASSPWPVAALQGQQGRVAARALRVTLTAVVALTCARAARAVDRPFMLWTRAEAAEIRKSIETEPWAKEAYDRLLADKDIGQPVRNLFRYSVMGDAKAGEEEKQYLLSFVGAPVDPREWSDNYITALRYDTLYGELTAEQRRAIEDTFRKHVRHQVEHGNPNRTRWNWLPNMQWPRTMGMHLMAVALADTALIEDVAASPGGWRYYLDDYLADGQFYCEEFGKTYSMIGEMFLWCRGCERLGLDRLGYGYTGRGGATMQRFLRSLQAITYPRVDRGGERPAYPRVTMGDAKGGAPLQQTLVAGTGPGDADGDPRWRGSNMNGRDHKDRIIAKMMAPLWFELAHVKWPDDGWAYFLCAERAPGDTRYVPSLLWGCPPVDPAAAPPPPAPSGAYPERGFALLRAEEGPTYWSSPAPAVALQFSQPYAHGVPDAFAILGLVAFNRPLYLNRQVSAGYAGTDPGWSNSARSHSTVLVDSREPARRAAAEDHHVFAPPVKFASVRSAGVYEGVDQTRALVLTRDYLLDVFALAGGRPRTYHWLLHGLGQACPDNPADWTPTTLLTGTLYDLQDVRAFFAQGQPWSVTMLQPPSTRLAGDDDGSTPDRVQQRVGARVTLLGEPGTVAHLGLGPMRAGEMYRLNDGAAIPGEPSIVAYRQGKATAFVALHEPFARAPRPLTVRRIAQTADAVLVAVEDADGAINDRIALRWGADADQPLTLGGGGEAVRFARFGWLRIGHDSVEAWGEVQGCRVSVKGQPRLAIGGKDCPTEFAEGSTLLYPPEKAPVDVTGVLPRPAAAPGAPLAVRWSPPLCALPLGGTRTCEAVIDNLSAQPFTGAVAVQAPACALVEPATVAVGPLAPGASTALVFRIAAATPGETAAAAVALRLEGEAGPFQLQPQDLPVTCGVRVEHREDWPRRFVKRITAPRYVVDIEYTRSVAAERMLDGEGRRRDGDYPSLWQSETNRDGRAAWKRRDIGGYVAFNPNATRAPDGRPFLAEMGQHPHGYFSPLVYHFTEDWVLTRLRDPQGGGPVAFTCGPWDGGKRKPAVERAIAPDGAGIDKPANGVGILALFRADRGDDATGLLCLYPEGATWSEGRVAQPAAAAMAFTWCRDDEVAAMVKAWQSHAEPSVRPHRQGDVRGGSAGL